MSRLGRWTLWLSLLSVGAVHGQVETARPNIVIILADDLGYGETGMQGNPEIPTPHIDALAAGGVRCTAGYVTASFCSPSRAGLLTGRYQTRFGHELNPVGRHNLDPRSGLPPEEETLAERLRAHGYATGLIGKWHLGGTAETHPMSQGFDEFYGFLHEGHYYVPPPYDGVLTFLRRRELPDPAEGGPRFRIGDTIYSNHMGHDEPPYDDDNPVLRGRRAVEETEYLTEAITRESLGFIRRHRDRPFLLLVSYSAVHSPMQGLHRDLARYDRIDDVHRRIFAAVLGSLDDGVGSIHRELRAQGLEDRTLVFFLSDNGGPTRELTSSNLPLRGGKGDVYEGGLRVPFVVHWPRRLPAGTVEHRAVSSLDLFATAVAAAHAGAPGDGERLDGVDLVPYLAGRQPGLPHPTLFWRMGSRTALRQGPWKLVRPRGAAETGFELYHLGRDPGETDDRGSAEPERLEELLQAWRRIDASMVAPRWTPPRRRR